LLNEAHGVFDRLPDRGRGGRVGAPGNYGACDRNRQHGEFFGKALFGRFRLGDGSDRHPKTERVSALFKHSYVAEQNESRDGLLALRQPGLKRDVGPNPGRLAKGEG
jgi:hypothetical protein